MRLKVYNSLLGLIENCIKFDNKESISFSHAN